MTSMNFSIQYAYEDKINSNYDIDKNRERALLE